MLKWLVIFFEVINLCNNVGKIGMIRLIFMVLSNVIINVIFVELFILFFFIIDREW